MKVVFETESRKSSVQATAQSNANSHATSSSREGSSIAQATAQSTPNEQDIIEQPNLKQENQQYERSPSATSKQELNALQVATTQSVANDSVIMTEDMKVVFERESRKSGRGSQPKKMFGIETYDFY